MSSDIESAAGSRCRRWRAFSSRYRVSNCHVLVAHRLAELRDFLSVGRDYTVSYSGTTIKLAQDSRASERYAISLRAGANARERENICAGKRGFIRRVASELAI